MFPEMRNNTTKSQTPKIYFVISSFSYVAAMFCSNAALGYVNYPTQVLAKSCKMIPGICDYLNI